MKLTIKEIAEICGISKSTVSRVLNQDPNVKLETRQKVQKVITELQFQPNRAARAMRGELERVVGIIVTRLDSTSESQTLRAILRALQQRNITPLIVESRFNLKHLKQEINLFQNRQVDGLILFGFSELNESLIQCWDKPLVTIARAYPGYSAVFYDDYNAVKYLAEILYQQGHRRIGYLGVNDTDETTGKERTQAYLDFCRQYSLEPYLELAELSLESGYQKIPFLMKRDITALICATGTLAIASFKFLQNFPKKIPLVCIGKNPILHALFPQLKSLDFGYEQAGKTAVELLEKQLNGNDKVIHRKITFQRD